MGAACSECNTFEEEHYPQLIVSKQLFVIAQSNSSMFDQITSLSHNQLPEQFKNYNFYRKGLDTYFIGSIEDNSTTSNYGILYKPNKTLYYGQFLHGRFHGKGTVKIINKNITFKGEFNEGRPSGNGYLSDNDRTFQFEGKWENRSQPSSGVLEIHNNDKIKQVKFTNYESGNVQIIYTNGSSYQGFIDKETLLPQGIGKIIYNSGDSYDGEWVNGKFHGHGVYKFKDGRFYSGGYEEGLKHGEGKLHFSQNKQFVGTWKKGKRDGYGRLIQKNGNIVEKGIYRDNKFNYEQTEQYLNNYMEKVIRQELKQYGEKATCQ